MSVEDSIAALKLARKHAQAGNVEAALKWARKSNSISPNPDAAFLIEKLESGVGSGSGAAAASGSASTSQSTPSAGAASGSGAGLRSRTAAAASASTSNGAAPEKTRDFTPEQAAVVKRVNEAGRKHDYYAVLGLKKDDKPDENAIKKGYKRLALQLHPDKNGAPGADEAFKIVSKAFTILSDGDKKAIYDRHGGDPDDRRQMGGGGGGGFQRGGAQQFRTYGGGGMGAEIDPQDLFNMFFGGGGAFGGPSATFTFGGPGMQGARVHRAGGRPQQAGRGRQQPAAQETNALLQLLPLLILGLFSLLAYLPNIFATADPSYTWSPSGNHRAQRFTPRHGVTYYVDTQAWEQHPWVADAARAGGASKGPSNLRKFEDRVENNWKNILYSSCEQAREHQQRRIMATRGFLGMGAQPDLERKIRAEKYETCERLKDFGIRM